MSRYYDKSDIESLITNGYCIVMSERGAGKTKAMRVNREIKSRYGNKTKRGRKNGRKKD